MKRFVIVAMGKRSPAYNPDGRILIDSVSTESLAESVLARLGEYYRYRLDYEFYVVDSEKCKWTRHPIATCGYFHLYPDDGLRTFLEDQNVKFGDMDVL